MQYKIIVDKQPSSNPSDEKKEYIIDIEELRVKGDVYDSLNIEKDRTYVTRRLSLSEYGVLTELEEPIIQELPDLNIELFEGDNYIYLMDMQGNKFYAEYLVKNDFTDLYVTTNQMNSAITQTAESIELSVNQKLTSYATNEDLEEQVTELNSTITQTANEINAEVEKKVDEETITGAYLILKINGDTSEAKLNADKIELSANDILNLLAGNTINLTSKNIVISSDFLSINKNGKIEIRDMSEFSTGNYFVVKDKDGNIKIQMNGFGIWLDNISIQNDYIFIGSGDEEYVGLYQGHINVGDQQNNTYIYPNEVSSPKLTQTSLESIKKNITKFTKNAIDIINNSDIYEYNLKSDKDTDKKLIGFIIGNNYKTPTEVISKTGQAIEHGSAIGILWKAFQQYMEQQDNLIEDLTKRLEKLEKEVQHE